MLVFSLDPKIKIFDFETEINRNSKAEKQKQVFGITPLNELQDYTPMKRLLPFQVRGDSYSRLLGVV